MPPSQAQEGAAAVRRADPRSTPRSWRCSRRSTWASPSRDSLSVDIPGGRELHALVRRGASTRSTTRSRRPDRGALALITREPLGVVGAIVPWNFPLLMAAWKIGADPGRRQFAGAEALGEVAADGARGRASSRSRRAFRRACSTSCPGFGQTAGKALALHMDVDCIAFTGSTATGRIVMQYAGQSNLKRVSLECGGKSPNIVLADYPDLDRGRDGRGVRDLLQPGRGVLGRLAPAGAGRHQGRVAGEGAGDRRARMQPGDPLDPGDAAGRDRR